MTLIIIVIMLMASLLIATENWTNINKAAVAVFAGTVGWVLYICYGTDFVLSFHPSDFSTYLSDHFSENASVKQFIAQNIFLKYVGRAAEVVLFLLATMTIVEVLNNNGCFDFISQLLRTHSTHKILWTLTATAFLLSINLDNLTTTVMMLTIMHKVIQSRRQRMIFGSAIVLAANSGGAITVIGDPAGLVLWNMGYVTPTIYSLSMMIPCLIACAIPVWWIGRMLPDRADVEWITMPYRGNDTRLKTWQRLLMLFVGIGGLWLVPTFRSITALSPFLGALCVLSVLWIVNEFVNYRLINTEEMIQRRIPRVLQYGVIQMILFVIGVMLATGVVIETGIVSKLSSELNFQSQPAWLIGIGAGIVSSFLDNFASAMSFFSIGNNLPPNSSYWGIVAFATAVGGNILASGSMSGLALLKMEHMRFGWYFRNVGWKAMLGGTLGLLWLCV